MRRFFWKIEICRELSALQNHVLKYIIRRFFLRNDKTLLAEVLRDLTKRTGKVTRSLCCICL